MVIMLEPGHMLVLFAVLQIQVSQFTDLVSLIYLNPSVKPSSSEKPVTRLLSAWEVRQSSTRVPETRGS